MIDKIELIEKKLKTEYEFITGLKYQGLIASLGATFASRAAEIDSKIDFYKKQSFLSTADIDYLAEHAGQLIIAYEALIAKGSVVFTGSVEAELEAGLKLIDGDLEYFIEDKIIIKEKLVEGRINIINNFAYMKNRTEQTSGYAYLNGKEIYVSCDQNEISFLAGNLLGNEAVQLFFFQSDPIRIRALETGSKYNKNFNYELSLETKVEGINTDARVIVLGGGRDVENPNDYRARVFNFMYNSHANFSDNHIKNIILENNPSIKKVWIKGGDFQRGFVNIFALNNFNQLSNDEKAKIKETVELIKPAHLPNSNIVMHSVEVNLFKVSIIDLDPYNLEELRIEIAKNLQYYFDQQDLFEKTVFEEELKCKIFDTSAQLSKVKNFTLGKLKLITNPGTYNLYSGVYFE